MKRLHFVYGLIALLLIGSQQMAPVATAATRNNVTQGGTFPFNDGFEGPDFGPDWSTQTANLGVVELSTDYFHSGVQGAFVGQNVYGYASSSLTLAIDLSGQTDVFLDYWVRRTGAGEYRHLYFSDNGGASWVEIWNLNTISPSFSHHVIDMVDMAADKGLALNDQFRIRFAYGSDSYGDAGDGLVIDDLRLTNRSELVASFPLALESFEATTFPLGFSTESYDIGAVEITTNYAHSGNQGIFLGQHLSGYAWSSLTLAIDLSGQTDVFLDYWVRRTGAGEYRRLYFSDNNGASWVLISNLDAISPSFSHHVIDMVDMAADKGLALNNQFRIRFVYDSDSSGDAGDGLVIDDVRLTDHSALVADFPLAAQSFEATTFPLGFNPEGYGIGTAEISTNYAHTGNRGVFLGQHLGGDAWSSLTLAIDLSGQTDVLLDYWARATGSGEYRRLYFSDNNGGSWEEIWNMDGISPSFSYHVIDVVDAATDRGLALNDQFRIRFVYDSDGFGDAGDGLVIDDVRVRAAQVTLGNLNFLPLMTR